MKAGHNQTEITRILARPKFTISLEVRRNKGLRGYRPGASLPLCQGMTTVEMFSTHFRRGMGLGRASAARGVEPGADRPLAGAGEEAFRQP